MMKRYLGLAVIVLFAMASLGPAVNAQDQQTQGQSGQQQAAPPDQSQGSQDPYGQADQNAPADQADQNPQSQPGVGRISFIHGNVSIQRGDSGDWIAATMNTPLEAGDRVSTGDGSRAEVQLDYANVIRLDQNSTVKITNFTRSQIQIEVGEGLVSYSVMANSQADVEIDTPNSAIHPLRQGEYRIAIVDGSQTQVTVRNGQAEVSEPQGSTRVESGQLITIQGMDNPQYQVGNAAASDDFDRWNDERDHVILGASSWQHTDRYYTGSQDLDAYGHWENVPDYGQVWVPDQSSGWAPYQAGTWEWEPYYGWTWVSYEPWGWAPYHYGRWFVYGGNWAWWPGPVGVYGGFGYYPVWAPAYVSFFGWGAGIGFNFGFGFGNIGWLACGPGDFFHPWWGWGVTRVGFVGFAGFHDRFGPGIGPLFRGPHGFSNFGHFDADPRIRAGVSSIRGDQFGRGIGNFQRGLSTQDFHSANFMTGRVPVTPTRQSLGRVEDHLSPSIARTASANNEHFFSQNHASFTQRSFNQEASAQQRMIDSSRGGTDNRPSNAGNSAERGGANQGFRPNGGSHQPGAGWHSFSGNGNSGGQGQVGAGNRPATGQGRPQGNSPARGGDPWHQFTPPSSANRGQQSRPSGNGNGSRPNGNGSNGNWHQFNQPSHTNSPRSGPGRGEFGSGGSSRGGSYGNSSRPQLDMRQPVTRQRSYGGSNRSYGGGGRSSSRPSGGGSHAGGGSHGGGSRGGGSHGGGHAGGGHRR
jgi:ferric-dicitrate binding protein FerR (iron transport regulator)